MTSIAQQNTNVSGRLQANRMSGLLVPAVALLAMMLTAPVLASNLTGQGERSSPSDRDLLSELGTGALLLRTSGGLQALPVLDFQVDLQVTGFMVHGTVTQVFRNPTVETIDALYAFPLPMKAAVSHMEIRIGERRIVSSIHEKEEARKIFEAARTEGRKAALLEQKRPNLFSTKVTGINADEEVHVRIEYVEELTYHDGSFNLVFPLTYTPRYDQPITQQSLAVPADPPRARITIRLQAGFVLEELVSRSHAITSMWDNNIQIIELSEEGAILADRDFHLSFTPQVGLEPEAAVVIEEGENGRYALLMVFPPIDDMQPGGLATETLFVVDISGSMSGPSMVQARAALIAAIGRLDRHDAFNILVFNEEVRALAGDYVPAEESQKRGARDWIESLRAGGGTRIDLALGAGLAMMERDETSRVERMIFMTDGAVSTEDAILGQIRSRLGPARLHTLGIGAAPNRYLMRKMAVAGRGLSDFITRADLAENDINRFLSRLSQPVMTDMELTWKGGEPLETYPSRLPDLHAGSPLVLSARFAIGTQPEYLVLEGRVGAGSIRRVVDIQAAADQGAGIATTWARHKVDELVDSLHEGADPAEVRRAVIETSMQFGIVSRYTSLVAVEEFPTAQGELRKVTVTNSVPSGGQLPLGGTQENMIWQLMALCAVAAGLAALSSQVLRRSFHRAGR